MGYSDLPDGTISIRFRFWNAYDRWLLPANFTIIHKNDPPTLHERIPDAMERAKILETILHLQNANLLPT
jgi:hypothetical protein